jgi:hypothetical protein
VAGTDRTPSPDLAWRNFRTVAIGCPVGWLLAVALYVALACGRFVVPGDPRALTAVMAMATALYAVLPAVVYPWDRHREGTWLVQGTLAVLFVAGFLLGWYTVQAVAVVRC